MEDKVSIITETYGESTHKRLNVQYGNGNSCSLPVNDNILKNTCLLIREHFEESGKPLMKTREEIETRMEELQEKYLRNNNPTNKRQRDYAYDCWHTLLWVLGETNWELPKKP